MAPLALVYRVHSSLIQTLIKQFHVSGQLHRRRDRRRPHAGGSADKNTSKTNHASSYLLQRVGDVWLHLRVLREDQTGQQGGALLGRQGAQSVFEQQLSEQELVAADLAGHAAL